MDDGVVPYRVEAWQDGGPFGLPDTPLRLERRVVPWAGGRRPRSARPLPRTLIRDTLVAFTDDVLAPPHCPPARPWTSSRVQAAAVAAAPRGRAHRHRRHRGGGLLHPEAPARRPPGRPPAVDSGGRQLFLRPDTNCLAPNSWGGRAPWSCAWTRRPTPAPPPCFWQPCTCARTPSWIPGRPDPCRGAPPGLRTRSRSAGRPPASSSRDPQAWR